MTVDKRKRVVAIEAAVFRFFHDQLPDDRRRAFYDAAESAIRIRQETLVCPRIVGLERLDYLHILEHVYDDHPEFFYFYPLRCDVTIQPLSVSVALFYRYPAQVQRVYEAALETAVGDILARCFPAGISAVPELRREKILFDWITCNVAYDHDSLRQSETDPVEDVLSVAWNAYGALVLGRAVCEGIACAFKLLCDRVGLPSIVVLGSAGGRHAWNLVRVNKKFYHVDCTWDLRAAISTEVPFARYRYFNLPDRIISATHQAESTFLPRCGSLRYNPFRIRGLCASDPAEALAIARRQASDGYDRFALMALGFRFEDCADAIRDDLAQLVKGSVVSYTDKSGYFLGIVIEKRGT